MLNTTELGKFRNKKSATRVIVYYLCVCVLVCMRITVLCALLRASSFVTSGRGTQERKRELCANGRAGPYKR
jgi:hypothetical protein